MALEGGGRYRGVTLNSSPYPPRPFASAAGILAGVLWGFGDVLSKPVFAAGTGALTLSSLRGVIGIAFMAAWLKFAPPSGEISRRQTVIALFVGLLFGVNVLSIFNALHYLPVPVAILAYFIYPLMTGLVGAALGLERVNILSILAALAAFAGLALMIGASPASLSAFGLTLAFLAAGVRVAMLLVARSMLAGVDGRLTTWYSSLSSTALLMVMLLATGGWQPPTTAIGGVAMVAMALFSSAAVAFMFISTMRVGAFRTALLTNVEPLVSTLGAMIFLGESLTTLQGFGAAVMIVALCAFQLVR